MKRPAADPLLSRLRLRSKGHLIAYFFLITWMFVFYITYFPLACLDFKVYYFSNDEEKQITRKTLVEAAADFYSNPRIGYIYHCRLNFMAVVEYYLLDQQHDHECFSAFRLGNHSADSGCTRCG